MRTIMHCQACGRHTMEDNHCSLQTAPVAPPKYSPQDKYAAYRRKAKETERKAQGIL